MITGSCMEITAESCSARMSHITLDKKHTGKPSAGKLHAGFDEAGTGNRLTIRLVRHSQRKQGATDRLNLRSMAPVLDPTREKKIPKSSYLVRQRPNLVRLIVPTGSQVQALRSAVGARGGEALVILRADHIAC